MQNVFCSHFWKHSGLSTQEMLDQEEVGWGCAITLGKTFFFTFRLADGCWTKKTLNWCLNHGLHRKLRKWKREIDICYRALVGSSSRANRYGRRVVRKVTSALSPFISVSSLVGSKWVHPPPRLSRPIFEEDLWTKYRRRNWRMLIKPSSESLRSTFKDSDWSQFI